MFCKNCGKEIPDDSTFCSFCGAATKSGQLPGSGPAQRTVPNYLVQAILVTIFCCLPFGIAAIVYAAQVNSKLQVGDYQGAVQSSEKAKQFCWIAFGLGLAVGIIYFIIIIAGGMRGFRY